MKKEMLRLNALVHEYESLAGQPDGTARDADRADIAEPADTVVTTLKLTCQQQMTIPPDNGRTRDDSRTAHIGGNRGSVGNPSSDASTPLKNPGRERLKQTNLEDYLRENGWPQSSES